MFLAVGYNICNLFFAEHNLFVWLQQRYWMGFALEIRGLPDAYAKCYIKNVPTVLSIGTFKKTRSN